MMPKPKPFFSIIIPTYNHAHFIGRCLDSLLRQNYVKWEAIVVNNFSEDNTIEIVESYDDPRIRLINNSNRGIIAVSRNKGITDSKGDWICFLDSDDWWHPDKLTAILPYLDEFDFIYHNLDKFNSEGKMKGMVQSRMFNGFKDLIINGNVIPNSSVAINKKLVDSVGLLSEDPKLFAVEDIEYWIRVAMISDKFKYLNLSLGAYWLEGNISASEKQISRERYLNSKYSKYLSDVELELSKQVLSFREARILHKLKYFKKAEIDYKKASKTSNISKKVRAYVGIICCKLNICL